MSLPAVSPADPVPVVEPPLEVLLVSDSVSEPVVGQSDTSSPEHAAGTAALPVRVYEEGRMIA